MSDGMKRWWRAARPWSFTVSLVPPLLGALLAVQEFPGLKLNGIHVGLTLLGCMLAHAGSNMFSDYHDFLARVDRDGTFGSSGSRVLLDGLMAPRTLRNGALLCFAAASLIGLYFVLSLERGLWLLLPAGAGGMLAFFYTARPFTLKYYALGDVAVFVAFGPAMAWGAWFVHVQQAAWAPLLYALPVAFLVDAILHSNNLRDIATDREVRIRTVPIVIGERNAQRMYHALVAAAYLSVLLLVLLARAPWSVLLVLLSLPLAFSLCRRVAMKERLAAEQFALIDAQTAQLHSVFSLLFLAGLALNLWLR